MSQFGASSNPRSATARPADALCAPAVVEPAAQRLTGAGERTATPVPAPGPAATPIVWLPAHRMRQYQRAKLIGAALFALIFAGWLYLQWSNPPLRWFTLALLALTGWVTFRSVREDARRTRGRRLAVVDDALLITIDDLTQRLPLSAARLVWREDHDTTLGLWFYDAQGQTLAHLDGEFFAEQAEARMFMGWLRRHTTLPLVVQWPTVE